MKRIVTAAVLTPLFVWLILAAPAEAFRISLALVGALAFHEFTQIAGTGRLLPSWIGAIAGIAMLYAQDATLVVILAALAGMTLALRAGDLKESLPAAGAFALGIVYIFGAWRCANELRLINPHWLLFAMLLSWVGDTAALYVGKSIGKHKLAPRVSPAKTWEGAVGSVVGAVIGGVVYAHYLIPSASIVEVTMLAVGGNIAGQIGDLAESAFKRGAGVKDSGTLLPGHGGWLDRIDSSLFAVPVVYALLRYV
ncbi:MAG: phosphatidate cytidylyltransferase [Bryobacteraceae bacterium]